MSPDPMLAEESALSRLRVPPHSIEAEQALLGALMLDSRPLADVLAVIAAEDFYRTEHRSIFAAICAVDARGREVDILTVHDQLGDSSVSLGELNALATASPSASGAVRYAAIVSERAQRRRLIAAMDDASTAAFRHDADASAIAEALASVLAGAHRRDASRAPKLMSDVVLARTGHYSDLAEGKAKSGIPLGIPMVDRMLGGGLRPSGVYVIAARPSVGKSSLAQQFAIRSAMDGHTTLMLSQEMPAGELADRAVAHVGRVDYGRIATGGLADSDWGGVVDASDALRGVPLWIDDEEALSLRKVAAKARGVRGLEVLVVDYLQLMQSEGKSDANRNAEIERISRGMKALAKQLGIAVILLSQLNRQVELRPGRRPTCADLRDSGAIEQDADVVMLLWTHREMTDGHRIVGMRIDKNRQGQKADIALHFDGSRQRWGESSEPLDEPAPTRGRGGDL